MEDRPTFKEGDIVLIREGWAGQYIALRVLGDPVFQKQWWVPVYDPREEDPTFHKSAGLVFADSVIRGKKENP